MLVLGILARVSLFIKPKYLSSKGTELNKQLDGWLQKAQLEIQGIKTVKAVIGPYFALSSIHKIRN